MMASSAEALPGGVSAASLSESPRPWSLPQRILFRFVFCYLVLYAAPDPPGRVDLVDTIPGGFVLGGAYASVWHAIVPWVARTVFHLGGRAATYFPTGSGDTTLAYVQNLCFLVVAGTATAVWSVLDRRRSSYHRLHAWLRLVIRYTLAVTLFAYGFAKIFPLQFPPTGLARFVQQYGDFSPMGVLWSFMGASTAYTIFSGVCEAAAGTLLLLRRTTTLGALAAFGVLLNVVMLNFCYDVPVKLYSSNLLLMAVFLAAPEMPRLANVLLFNRTAQAADLPSIRFKRKGVRIAANVVWTVFVAFLFFRSVFGGWTSYKTIYNAANRPPLYGLYQVESFTRNGAEVPPLETDATRWKRLIAQYPTALSVQMMDGSLRLYATEYDPKRNQAIIKMGQRKYPLSYSRPDPEHLLIEGSLENQSLSVRLRKVDAGKFLLASRGFHWITELPFNR
jgi:hypothetical protein